jgi:hypothetical protein
MRALIFGILILAVACGSQKNKVKNTNNQDLDKAPLTLVLSDNYGGSETEQLIVIRKDETLKSFFSKVNMTRKPGLQIPQIDFSTEMVVIYCAGKTSVVHSPIFKKLEEKDNQMVLGLEDTKEKGVPSTALLMPFHLYKMPLTDKEIILSKDD